MGLNLNKSDFRLRALSDADANMVRRWRNQDQIRRNMYTDHIIGPEEHAAWLARVLADPRSDYVIFEHFERPIGLVGFYDIVIEHRRADWAFYLGESDAVRGSGPAMELFALDHAFDSVGIEKLCCEVFSFNEPVIKMHKRFGFVEEGLRRAHYVKDGRGEDIVELALFRDDWSARRSEMHDGIFALAEHA